MPFRVLSQMPTPCTYPTCPSTCTCMYAARKPAYAEILRDILMWRLRFLIVKFGLIYPTPYCIMKFPYGVPLITLPSPDGVLRGTVRIPHDIKGHLAPLRLQLEAGDIPFNKRPGGGVIAIEDPGRNTSIADPCSSTLLAIGTKFADIRFRRKMKCRDLLVNTHTGLASYV